MKRITRAFLQKILPYWKVYLDNGCFDIISHSPAGEEVVVSVGEGTLLGMAHFVEEYRRDFDPVEHAAQIYHAKHYGSMADRAFYAAAPDGFQDLLRDARFIKGMYLDIVRALKSQAKKEIADGKKRKKRSS